jgi:acyl-coenzyme A synthetase/AMP-(fatty) acid ligase
MMAAFEPSVGDRFIGTASPSFDASIPVTLLPLLTGGTLVTLSPDAARDPFLLADELSRYRPQVLQTAPATLRMLTEMGWAGDPDLDVWTGGERTPPGVIDHIAPRVRTLRNWYGPTEATVQVSMATLRAGDHESPVGVPFEYSPCVLLDAAGAETPPGEIGELCITGRSLARGYLNDPVRTAARFCSIERPDGTTMRAYRTGDLARAGDDGSLVIVGRVDDQLNVQGYRVEPSEIEARLVEHAGVLEAVVVARPDQGDDDTQLVAFVRANEGVAAQSLRDFAGETLPRHMVPAHVELVDSYPVNTTDKIDRQRLCTMALSTSASTSRGQTSGGGECHRARARGARLLCRRALDRAWFRGTRR